MTETICQARAALKQCRATGLLDARAWAAATNAIAACDVALQPAGGSPEHLLHAREAAEAAAAIGRVRVDSGEVHIVPTERNAEASPLRDRQTVYASPQPCAPSVEPAEPLRVVDVAAEQAAFCEWASAPLRAGELPLDTWDGPGQNGGFKNQQTYQVFYGWLSHARHGAAPQASTASVVGLPR